MSFKNTREINFYTSIFFNNTVLNHFKTRLAIFNTNGVLTLKFHNRKSQVFIKILTFTPFSNDWVVAVAQWVRVFAPQGEGWVFESQPRQIQVVKTGSDSSTAKQSITGVSVTGPRR